MTNEAAHVILENLQRIYTQYRELYSEDLIEANGLAILALEKQIPKKPQRKITDYSCPGNWVDVCPTCGRKLVERVTTEDKSYPIQYNMTNYCRCGQKLDRSQKNEENET